MLFHLALIAATTWRIFVDPEVRVSNDGNGSHMEAPITASATEPNKIYAAAEVLYPGTSTYDDAKRIYVSNNAGATWSPIYLQIAGGSWDNAMAGGTGGTAYFVTHEISNGLSVYRTHDGGATWQVARILTHPGWDREYAVVDTTHSMYAGRLYIEGEGSVTPIPKDIPKGADPRKYFKDGVKVVYSDDGGKSFTHPVMACHRDGFAAGANPHPVVMSDGTLVVTCLFYPYDVAQRATWTRADFGVVVSTNGGRTFSPYHHIGYKVRLIPTDTRKTFVAGDYLYDYNSPLAVAPEGGLFANRLYSVWSSIGTGERDALYIAHSDDRGAHWSAPHLLDPTVPKQTGKIRQVVPMLAVNKDGVVAVAWFDARNAPHTDGYDVYFSASTDGGETFTAPARLTAATSYPQRAVHAATPQVALLYGTTTAGSTVNLSFVSPFALRTTGGDFSTMTADAAGRFHPLWPDARGDAWQLYTSTIHVVRDDRLPATACVGSPQIQLVIGEVQWLPDQHEVRVPMQLLNTTDSLIVNPLVAAIDPGQSPGKYYGTEMSKLYPSVAATQITFPLSPAQPLLPSALTAPQIWTIPAQTPELTQFNPNVTISCSP